jgi:hypothetical protein
MSSSSSAPTFSSPFSKLPLETIKQIVDEVNEQDKRWTLNPVAAVASENDIESGTFPAMSGKGILALSTVNVALRALSLPYMLKVRSCSSSLQSTH